MCQDRRAEAGCARPCLRLADPSYLNWHNCSIVVLIPKVPTVARFAPRSAECQAQRTASNRLHPAGESIVIEMAAEVGSRPCKEDSLKPAILHWINSADISFLVSHQQVNDEVLQPPSPDSAFWQTTRSKHDVGIAGIVTCLWRIDTVAVKRSDPRNALRFRTQIPNDFVGSLCRR